MAVPEPTVLTGLATTYHTHRNHHQLATHHYLPTPFHTQLPIHRIHAQKYTSRWSNPDVLDIITR